MNEQKPLKHQRRHFGARIFGLGALAMLAAILWTGCKARTTDSTSVNPAGTYALVSVDGKTLPYPVAHTGSPVVKSGAFTINADGTCSSKITFTTSSGSDATREVKARYTRDGGKLTMKWEGAGTTRGTIDGDTFTMNNEGNIFAYRK